MKKKIIVTILLIFFIIIGSILFVNIKIHIARQILKQNVLKLENGICI